jgi:hypothetical protein
MHLGNRQDFRAQLPNKSQSAARSKLLAESRRGHFGGRDRTVSANKLTQHR